MQATSHPAAEHDSPGLSPSGAARAHGVTGVNAPAHGVTREAGHGAAQHGAAEHGGGEHGGSHGGGHDGEHHQEFNWVHGMIGVKEGVEPSLLWRTPDMPTPFAAVLLNTAILFGLLFKFAAGPVSKGLAERRQRIMRGIDEATKMQEEAKQQLAFYRQKLDNLDAEIERVKREMREGAEHERRRILEEAAARRTRLEQEARALIQQELVAVRNDLTRETAQAALRSARELLLSNTSTDDHRRLCEQYLETLQPQPTRQVSRPAPVSGRSETT